LQARYPQSRVIEWHADSRELFAPKNNIVMVVRPKMVLLRVYLHDVAFLQKNTKESQFDLIKNEIWFF